MVRKRAMANERERERTRSLNQALNLLRNRIPVSEAEKRSKIQTLRVAKEYIEFLTRIKQIPQSATASSAGKQPPNSEPATTNQTHLLLNAHQLQYAKEALVSSTSGSSSQTDNNSNQVDPSLIYMFYKFRLNKND